jgi:hypothetical protein
MSTSGPANLLESDPNTKTMVIPASVTVLTPASFANADSVLTVRFDPGSSLRKLTTGTFGGFTSLKSICIAASVESVHRHCFIDQMSLRPSPIEKVTFEPGSAIRKIQFGAFFGCKSLKGVCLPATLKDINWGIFPQLDAGENDLEIHIEKGEDHFEWTGKFAIDLNHHSIIQYIGRDSPALNIPEVIKIITSECFKSCLSFRYVDFGPNPRLLSIEDAAFLSCKNLQTISIPSSVTFLGEACFADCWLLHTVTFGPASELACIPLRAFGDCWSLEVIVLPSSVKTLCSKCFSGCRKLARSPLPADSQIVRIEQYAFSMCGSLRSFVCPSSLEYLGRLCFESCDCLSPVGFPTPSHLRELLDFSPFFAESVSVPDSVEVLSLRASPRDGLPRLLTFGGESRLLDIAVRIDQHARCPRIFLQVSRRSLKLFRNELEFQFDSA